MRMTLPRLIFKEIAYRKAAFAMGLLSVFTAMTAWVGADALLRAHDLQTDRLLVARARTTQREMQRMEDDYRRIMRDLGYNVMIVAGGQDLAALRAQGHPDVTMPFDYVERLAQGGIETLNHLLPVLQQRVEWPEHGVSILLSGTPGQIPVSHLTQFLTADGRAYRNPIMPAVPPGELVLGHHVARTLGLHPGDHTELMGSRFRVRAVNPAEGTSDDIAVWCDLDWMQATLGLPGRINLILALECVCHADSLGAITAEVDALLPDVQVLEFSSRVRARALARNRAEQAHRTAMAAELDHRREVAAAHRRFAAVLAPLVVAAATAWLCFLFIGNVRERVQEIGVLRAIGVTESDILILFAVKSLLLGGGGTLAGFLAGHALGALWAGLPVFSRAFFELLQGRLLLVGLPAALALCVLAVWLPALWAIRRDPARILCEA